MEGNKGKPMTTSVPSISIKFHANAEQLEELHASDDEQSGNEAGGAATGQASEHEMSPLKYLPRLVKRSTSIDNTPNIDASPPSDPWRFFSDIKGKITKSVEEKITEIKARNQEEGSPHKSKSVKDGKDKDSSLSDSEDLSESSISKTCGIVSTTEGAEMSSDDDTPSIEKDRKTEGIRRRFRLIRPKSASKEGTLSKKALVGLYNINTDKAEQLLPEESEIESAVDALEDLQLGPNDDRAAVGIGEQFDNIKLDHESVINVKEVSGTEVKPIHWATKVPKTVYAPVGFVDFREKPVSIKSSLLRPTLALALFISVYLVVHMYSTYMAGFMIGAGVVFLYYYVVLLLGTPLRSTISTTPVSYEIVQIPAVKEFHPLCKYEGWVNEFPETYNPHTYHISQTQSVFLRLQGNLLRMSHTRSKVPKRALWNEPKIKPTFTHHRIYNLLGATVSLLPQGLAKKRHWSKKYPICVTLNKDQMEFESTEMSASSVKGEDEDDLGASVATTKPKRFSFSKKKVPVLSQRFSKLTEENEEFEMDSENSRASTPSPISPEDDEQPVEDDTQKILDEALQDSLTKDDDDAMLDEELSEDWGTFTPPDKLSPGQTRLYIFGRTDREKEDWFRRLKAATHRGANVSLNDTSLVEASVSHTLLDKAESEIDYMKYMLIFNKLKKGNEGADEALAEDVQWINAFLGRILFDCLRDSTFTQRVKDKIQRKMSSIKLPYFIEGLIVTELSLGQTPPLVHKAGRPVVDERGLWIDLDVAYEGLVVLILQTKLNLMKLKQPPVNECSRTSERSAMFNSDVEDSAESTSDEEGMCMFPVLDASGVPTPGLGGSSNTSKKFMKMVDRIAESKFFQAATEYRYIKKAMEGVSNTDLRLKVEVKELVGTLVINIPTPPSDRVWIGFRPVPNLALSAQPIVGERNITYLRITSWIEKKLLLEFQKLMVIPNMEDFIVPVMNPNLAE